VTENLHQGNAHLSGLVVCKTCVELHPENLFHALEVLKVIGLKLNLLVGNLGNQLLKCVLQFPPSRILSRPPTTLPRGVPSAPIVRRNS
jgi:hypothetical protein